MKLKEAAAAVVLAITPSACTPSIPPNPDTSIRQGCEVAGAHIRDQLTKLMLEAHVYSTGHLFHAQQLGQEEEARCLRLHRL